ncbi:MAG: divalent metal cation transporter [Bdellovibrio sp.]|nr:divalent metal cation transporter [Bdellovibrio sp.]
MNEIDTKSQDIKSKKLSLNKVLTFPHKVKLFFESTGPGVVTGAADDDPSGIGTYTIAGAQLGTRLLWTAVLTWPLMATVQMACARIGMVTGEGLASALEKKLPRPILVFFCFALFLANTLNVGADLSAMADSAEMLSGVSSHIFLVAFGVLISVATVELRYYHIAKVLKWLALTLFAYILTAFLIGPNWKDVLADTFVPHWPTESAEWGTLVAILGTTISPYLFFWQASQEVEEEKASGRDTVEKRQGATPKEILTRRYDVGVGTFFSNLVMYFVILAAALTLHKNGLTNIQTSKEAAAALAPLAGKFASLLYTVGIIGVGLLAIPTLTGSAAYALAETFGWDQGLDAKLRKAKAFYAVVISSGVFAIIFDFIDFSPIRALYWSAVINGLLAPFLLLAILWVLNDNKIMLNQSCSKYSKILIAITTAFMFAAAIGMFVYQ